jgi:L-alanine-DL-glutamate epimerase-like enolase superfamily enzyme
VRLTHRTADLHLREPFTISRSTDEEVTEVFVELEADGVVGYGEASPQEHYGESPESASAFLDEVEDLLGDDPFALEAIERRLGERPGEMAAKAALDSALHDLCGKIGGQPVWRLLGLERAGPPTSWTIWLGDPDDMAHRAEAVGDRFRRLKLKLGARLKKESPIPIYVDEDCHTLGDVRACAEIAHGVNIKLAKSGGIREAVRIAHAARALDLGVMLGCMIESSVAIAAACQVASLCDFVDLDGNILLADDPWEGVELVDGVQLPSKQAGLGVSLAAVQ